MQNQPSRSKKSDHYPIEMLMDGQVYATSDNRYGFQNKERDNEISTYTAMFWEYDPRLGRRWERDPVNRPWKSPYSCFSVSPIGRIDPDGRDDYFGANGKYHGSDGKGSKIRKTNVPIPGGLITANTKVDLQIGQANS